MVLAWLSGAKCRLFTSVALLAIGSPGNAGGPGSQNGKGGSKSPELCIETVIRLCTGISQNHHPCLFTLPFVANVCRRGDYSYATGLHMVQLMLLHPKTPSSLASLNSRTVLPFWYWLTKSSSKESVKLVLLNCCSYWQRSAAQTWRASCWCRLC